MPLAAEVSAASLLILKNPGISWAAT